MFDLEKVWCLSPKKRIKFLKVWLSTVKFNTLEIFSYFTIWTLSLSFLPIQNPFFLKLKYNMLLQISLGGFYITYICPRILKVEYLNAILRQNVLRIVDISSHHLPLFLFFYQNELPTKFSVKEFFFVNLPILGYLCCFDIQKKYGLCLKDAIFLMFLYGGVSFFLQNLNSSNMRVQLIVPFEEKDFCKEHGGRWDPDAKEWYTETINDELEKYRAIKIYVPFEEKDEAKSFGAIWNKQEESWMIPEGNSALCKKWKTDFRNYLNAPYEKASIIKTAGGRWDPKNKLWYLEEKLPDHLKMYASKFKRNHLDKKLKNQE